MGQLTIEHLLSFSHGGSDNLNNLCLACDECQKLLGNLPLTRKIELIVQRRLGLKTLEEAGGKPVELEIVDGREFLKK